MSPVTFIKRECPKHRGHWTMTDKCDMCHAEDFSQRLSETWRRTVEAIERAGRRVEQ